MKTIALASLLLVGCTAGPPQPDVQAIIFEPAPAVMRAGPGPDMPGLTICTTGDTYSRIAIASDHRGDDKANPSPRRLSLSVLKGGSQRLGQGALMMYRDTDAGVDECEEWEGVVMWQPETLEINGYCRARPEVRLQASLSGFFVEWAR